ncbi:MAG: hypothetical protein COB15_00905 [Flavobacteriales bacterium]|nr:MAG: hypothetical protein COB15_00905 [Flavobacteriales bacterium]
MKLFSIFLIAIICYGLYNGDKSNDVVYWYLGFIVLTIILYPLLKNNGKYVFKTLNDETIHFSLLFTKGLTLNSDTIKEVYIFTLLGSLYEYKIISNTDEIIIKKELIKKEDIKRFAVSNDITLIEAEIYHGGEQTILHQSSNII